MRAYKNITEDEKRQMYQLAASGINDSFIAEEFEVSEEVAERCIEDYFIALRQGMGFKVRGFMRRMLEVTEDNDDSEQSPTIQ